jgi:hypothetical protein
MKMWDGLQSVPRFGGVVQVAMSDARKRMKINRKDTKKTKKDQKKPSCSSFLRG